MEGFILLLGAPNDAEGILSTIAVERCEQAIREYRQNPGYKFLLTGGYGHHFNVTDKPHAYYTQSFLVAHGIPEADILGFVESSNTIEDARWSKSVITRSGVKRVIVITSDFHVKRARYIFERELPGVEIVFSGCSTHLPVDELNALKNHEERALSKLIEESK
jgi:uncharacterized SAM-binding protein YcdF (DUF218 family)